MALVVARGDVACVSSSRVNEPRAAPRAGHRDGRGSRRAALGRGDPASAPPSSGKKSGSSALAGATHAQLAKALETSAKKLRAADKRVAALEAEVSAAKADAASARAALAAAETIDAAGTTTLASPRASADPDDREDRLAILSGKRGCERCRG